MRFTVGEVLFMVSVALLVGLAIGRVWGGNGKILLQRRLDAMRGGQTADLTGAAQLMAEIKGQVDYIGRTAQAIGELYRSAAEEAEGAQGALHQADQDYEELLDVHRRVPVAFRQQQFDTAETVEPVLALQTATDIPVDRWDYPSGPWPLTHQPDESIHRWIEVELKNRTHASFEQAVLGDLDSSTGPTGILATIPRDETSHRYDTLVDLDVYKHTAQYPVPDQFVQDVDDLEGRLARSVLPELFGEPTARDAELDALDEVSPQALPVEANGAYRLNSPAGPAPAPTRRTYPAKSQPGKRKRRKR